MEQPLGRYGALHELLRREVLDVWKDIAAGEIGAIAARIRDEGSFELSEVAGIAGKERFACRRHGHEARSALHRTPHQGRRQVPVAKHCCSRSEHPPFDQRDAAPDRDHDAPTAAVT